MIDYNVNKAKEYMRKMITSKTAVFKLKNLVDKIKILSEDLITRIATAEDINRELKDKMQKKKTQSLQRKNKKLQQTNTDDQRNRIQFK